MEIKISTKQILKILYVISWIIFVGVCIDAGGFISNTFLYPGYQLRARTIFLAGT